MALLQDLQSQAPATSGPTTTAATATQAQTKDATAGQAGVTSASATTAATAAKASSSSVGKTQVGSTGYEATQGTVDSNQLASTQMNNITSQSSPLMERAKKTGILTAASRGMENSSIAAGAATGAMVDRAMPMAQQDASTYQQQSLTNQAAINRADEFSAGTASTAQLAEAGHAAQAASQEASQETAVSQFNADQQNRIETLNAELSTDVSKFNSQQLNQAEALNAQMQTATEQGNAEAYNTAQRQFAELQSQVSMANADQEYRASLASVDMENQANMAVMQQNAELNRQYLAGTQSMDLAEIQGQYQQLISANETASSLYRSYFDGISQAMANQEITPGRVAQYIDVQQTMLESSLRMMDNMNSLDLGEFELPGAVAGTNDNIIPVEGSGTVGPEPGSSVQDQSGVNDDAIRDFLSRRGSMDAEYQAQDGDEQYTDEVIRDYYERYQRENSGS